MKTILNVNYNMNIGGIETFLMSIYRNIDKNKYRIIFLCYEKNQYYEKEIVTSGSKIYYISSPKKVGFIKYYKSLKKIIQEEKIDIIHINTYYNSIYSLIPAWVCGVKKRIIHSHSAWEAKNIIRKIYWLFCKIIIHFLATDKLACSKKSGQKLFFGNFKIIPNGIIIKKFIYNQDFRNQIRKYYNISNKDIVIGHVGRLDPVKNHIFMLEILSELIKENPNYKMIFVGDGSEKNNIQKYIKEKKLEKNIILTGTQSDVYKYYNAFDLFLFPSKFEGLGITLVEAQINGLSCIANRNIPNEVNESNNVCFLPLDKDIWICEIKNKSYERNDVTTYIKNSKYNIENTIKIIEDIYQ